MLVKSLTFSIGMLVNVIKSIPPESKIYCVYKNDTISLKVVQIFLSACKRQFESSDNFESVTNNSFIFVAYCDMLSFDFKVHNSEQIVLPVYFLGDENLQSNLLITLEKLGKSFVDKNLCVNLDLNAVINYAVNTKCLGNTKLTSPKKSKLRTIASQYGWRISKKFPYLFRREFFDALDAPPELFFKTLPSFHDPAYTFTNFHKISYVHRHLSDIKSARQFKSVFNGNPNSIIEEYLSNLYSRPQYLHIDATSIKNILNIGIHAGYEIPLFLDLIGESGNLVNVDPGGEDYLDPIIAQMIKQRKMQFLKEFIGKGEELYFSQRGDGQFVVTDKHDSNNFRNSKSLRSIIGLSKVSSFDLIKIDIEGAEENIIDDVITYAIENRCCVALSIYHKFSHYYELPYQFMHAALGMNFDFFFRLHSLTPGEGVLYCIPSERLKSHPNEWKRINKS